MRVLMLLAGLGFGLGLGGCQLLPPAAEPPSASWLRLSAELRQLSPDAARQQLQQDAQPELDTGSTQLRLGLLNHQLHDRDGWVSARDLFRGLARDSGLDSEQRQLAALLEALSQAEINAEQRQIQLRASLEQQRQEGYELKQQVQQLQQQIDALTSLERSMQQRRARQDAKP